MLTSKNSLKNKVLFLSSSLLSLNAYATEVSPFIDLLIWDASEQTEGIWSSITTSPSVNTINASPQFVEFKWEPGLRGGFLFHSDPCFWDSKIYWTYFSTSKGYNFPPVGQTLTSQFFSGFLSLDVFFGADLNWDLAMNMLDYTASHAFKLSDNLIFRPAIGVKAGTIRQNIHVTWDAVIYEATETVKNNFAGVGPTLGLDLQWELFENFVLVGDLSAAWMWGNWKGRDVYNRPGAALGLISPATITSYLNNSKLGTMMFNYFLGLEWVYEGRSTLTFKLGYEMQLWANQLRLISFQQLPLHGDLTLQGATCRIYIDL